jgi:hypothetical protein
MRNLRVVRRGDDMPLYGKLTRVRKGRYEVIIKFVASKRVLHKEQLSLPTREAVQRFYLREFPTLTWGEPKYPKPKAKRAVSRKRTKPTKERKKKPNDEKRLQRTGATTRHR